MSESDSAADTIKSYLKNHKKVKLVDLRGKVPEGKDHNILDAVFENEAKYSAVGFLVTIKELDYTWVSKYVFGNNVSLVHLHGDNELGRGDADHVIKESDVKPGKDGKWRAIKARRSFLLDFLGVRDRVLDSK